MRRRIGMLGLLCVLGSVVIANAFDTSCGPFPERAAVPAGHYSPVLAVHTIGQATGAYRETRGHRTGWHIGTGDFRLRGQGIVVGQFIVTAAHVVYPQTVTLLHNQQKTTSLVLAIKETTVHVGAPAQAAGIPAEIVHLSHRYDIAILQPTPHAALQSLEYVSSATWDRTRLAKGRSLLQPGTCVVALVPGRRLSRLVRGHVAARGGRVVDAYAVAAASSIVAGLNPNTVTISTPVFPGDSGSPVLAFVAGEPRLVGVVTATRHPFEAKSYFSRIDPLLPMLGALGALLDPSRWGLREIDAEGE